jgi:hypothetical protein
MRRSLVLLKLRFGHCLRSSKRPGSFVVEKPVHQPETCGICEDRDMHVQGTVKSEGIAPDTIPSRFDQINFLR